MDKYYYTVAQLPALFFNRETSLSIECFLDEAQKWLSVKDYKVLSQIDINDATIEKKQHQVIKKYKDFESRLRADTAMWRKARKLDQEYKPLNFSTSVLKEGNPLEIETKLMEIRWAYIEEIEQDHNFDLGILILYYLKLQILRRLFTFNKEIGLTKFQKLYEVNI